MTNIKKIIVGTMAIAAISVISVSAAEYKTEPFVYTASGGAVPIFSHHTGYTDIGMRIDSIRQATEELLKRLSSEIEEKISGIYSSAALSSDGKTIFYTPIITETATAADVTEQITETVACTVTEQTTEAATCTVTEIETSTESTTLSADSSMVGEILSITNEIRKSNGLTGLVLDDKLTAAAEYHARDMAENNYFDHTSKDGTDFYTRITRFTTDYSMLGENIAKGDMTAEQVMDLWMNSDGHRANILNSDYCHIGIAHYNGYFVVDFAD